MSEGLADSMKSLERLIDNSSSPGGLRIFRDIVRHMRNEILSSETVIRRLQFSQEQREVEGALESLDVFLGEIAMYLEQADAAIENFSSAPFNPRRSLEPLEAMFDFKASQKDIGFQLVFSDAVPEQIEGNEQLFKNLVSLFLSYFFHEVGAGGALRCVILPSSDSTDALACHFELHEVQRLDRGGLSGGRRIISNRLLTFLIHSIVLSSGTRLDVRPDFSAFQLIIPLNTVQFSQCNCCNGAEAEEAAAAGIDDAAEEVEQAEELCAAPTANECETDDGQEKEAPLASTGVPGDPIELSGELERRTGEPAAVEDDFQPEIFEHLDVPEGLGPSPADPEPVADEAPHEKEEEGERKVRVLVADDNVLTQRYLTRLAEGVELSVACVNNGRELLARLEQEPFDICVLDCQIKIIDAYKAAGLIRTNEARTGGRTFIISLATHLDVDTEERSHDAGIDAYMTKPVHKERFVELLQEFAVRIKNGI